MKENLRAGPQEIMCSKNAQCNLIESTLTEHWFDWFDNSNGN